MAPKLYSHLTAVSCLDQLKTFETSTTWAPEILKFEGVDGLDVYNPSIPFTDSGRPVLAGRVESRDTEKSETVFFSEVDGVWCPIEGYPRLELQDPFVERIAGELVLGGVRVEWHDGKITGWYTDFYRGADVQSLKRFASGPVGMKDIRLIGLPSGEVAVFTRPMGDALRPFGVTAKARIGFAIIGSLDLLTSEVLSTAPLLDGHFLPEEWGGSNQLHLLRNGLIGVIGHKSYSDGKSLHYHSMAFVIDPETHEMSPCEIIATRSCFPPGPSKRPDLVDVTFTAGLIRNSDGTALLYTGLSDCQVGRVRVRDPFNRYE